MEGLIHWMEENRGFAKQRGGDDKLKPDWASMIECWKFKREIRSNLRRNLRRRGIDDKQRDLAQVGKTRAKVSLKKRRGYASSAQPLGESFGLCGVRVEEKDTCVRVNGSCNNNVSLSY